MFPTKRNQSVLEVRNRHFKFVFVLYRHIASIEFLETNGNLKNCSKTRTRTRSAYERQRNMVRALKKELTKRKEKLLGKIEEIIGKDLMKRCLDKDKLVKSLLNTLDTILNLEAEDAQSSFLLDQVYKLMKITFV